MEFGSNEAGRLYNGMDKKLLDDCFLSDRPRLRHDEALAILRDRVRPVVGRERVRLADALNRILADPAVAAQDVPAHTNAAVDGYSFAAADYRGDVGAMLTLGGRAAAGHPCAVCPRQAPRCGSSPAPSCQTATIPWRCRKTRTRAREWPRGCEHPQRPQAKSQCAQGGRGRRSRRDGARRGVAVAAAGSGRACRLRVGRGCLLPRLKVAILASGDEIVRPGASLPPGQVYDANSAHAGGSQMPERVRGSSISAVLPDDAEIVRRRLAETAAAYDVIITSGGASRGEEDHMATALAALGQAAPLAACHQARASNDFRPNRRRHRGRSARQSRRRVCLLSALRVAPAATPGRRAVAEPRRVSLPAHFAFPNRKLGRREFWRGMLVPAPQGWAVVKFPRDGSGLISGLRAADGLIEIPEDVPEVKWGDPVAFMPFFGIWHREPLNPQTPAKISLIYNT